MGFSSPIDATLNSLKQESKENTNLTRTENILQVLQPQGLVIAIETTTTETRPMKVTDNTFKHRTENR